MPTLSFKARFIPQRWDHDRLVEVPPELPDSWDVTRAFCALPLSVRDAIWCDTDAAARDGLALDPNAPAWVREWVRHSPYRVDVDCQEVATPAPNGWDVIEA